MSDAHRHPTLLAVVVAVLVSVFGRDARGQEAGGRRLTLGAGIVNGHEYLPPDELPNLGLSIDHRTGYTGMEFGRITWRVSRRNWIGIDARTALYRSELSSPFGGTMPATEVRVTYVGAAYERDLVRDDAFGGRIALCGGGGVVIHAWQYEVVSWPGNALLLHEARTRTSVAGEAELILQKRLAESVSLSLGGGGLISGQFHDAVPTGEDYLGLRLVFALAGLCVEW